MKEIDKNAFPGLASGTKILSSTLRAIYFFSNRKFDHTIAIFDSFTLGSIKNKKVRPSTRDYANCSEYSNQEQLPVFPTRITTGTLNLSRCESNDSGISLGSNYMTNSADKTKSQNQNFQTKRVTFSGDLTDEDNFRSQRKYEIAH